MIKSNIFVIIASLFAVEASAFVEVQNSSGHPISVSFHGYLCSSFEHERNYKPCALHSIEPGESVYFSDLIPDNTQLSRQERAIVPSIKFSRWLSYPCKIRDFIVVQICNIAPQTTFEFDTCPNRKTAVSSTQRVITHPNANLLLQTFSLSVTEEYILEILPETEYFPTQSVWCRLTHLADVGQCPKLDLERLEIPREEL